MANAFKIAMYDRCTREEWTLTSLFVILLTSHCHLRTEVQRGAVTCPQTTQPVGPECPWGRGFSTHPCDGAGSQLAAWAWGTDTQGWGRSALSPERAASSTLKHSCGADSEFPPHVVEGRGWGTAAGLFPLTERSLCPRLHFAAFTCIACLNAHKTQGGRSCYPHFSDEETEALKGSHLLKVT